MPGDRRALVQAARRRAVALLRHSRLARRLYRRSPLVVRRARLFVRYQGRVPRVLRPQTFSEKINWRVCFDRREEIAWTCDKLRMKEEALRRDPGICVPATLWQGTDVSELAGVRLPDRWVLKANHASQLVHLGLGQPSVGDLEQITDGWLEPSYQQVEYLEWAYGHARRLLFVEEWIGDDEGASPPDLKFLCFDGEVAAIQVSLARFSAHAVAFYDPSWRRIPVANKKFPAAPDVPRPHDLEALLQHAARLSAGFDFMRVDLYSTERGVFFGEYTPYPASGFAPYEPPEFEMTLGRRWTLPTTGTTRSWRVLATILGVTGRLRAVAAPLRARRRDGTAGRR